MSKKKSTNLKRGRQLRVKRLVRPIGVVKPIGPSSDDFEAWLAKRPDIAARFDDSKPYASRHTAYGVWRSAWMACEREHGIRPNDRVSVAKLEATLSEPSEAPVASGVMRCADLIGVSREYALHQHRKYRQQLESCDRATLEALAMLLIQKRSVDGLNGRRWDAEAHLYFEDAVESMMRSEVLVDRTKTNHFGERSN